MNKGKDYFREKHEESPNKWAQPGVCMSRSYILLGNSVLLG